MTYSLTAIKKYRSSAKGKAKRAIWRASTAGKISDATYRQSSKARRNHLKHALRHKYGLTLDPYDARVRAQGGRCAICRQLPNGMYNHRLHVDHDHTTGRVRGLLCGNCNSGLGSFKDDPLRLHSAITYLNEMLR
jgi:Recombination endonuclease VII